jgi:hypothetical protein
MARQLTWSLVAKLAALILLWWLFFSGRFPVTPESISEHLGITGSHLR